MSVCGEWDETYRQISLFDTNKWVERQNRPITKQFTEIVRKIESLYRSNAARQVEAAQRNVLADYGELYQLRKDVKTLIEDNDVLKSTLETMLDQLANPSLRSKIFAIADALAGGTSAAISSGGGGGGNSDSDLRLTVADWIRRKKHIGGGAWSLR